MEPMTSSPKVALIDFDGQPVPDWIGQPRADERSDFAANDCKTRSDLATHAGDAHVVWLFGGSRILNDNLDAVPRCRAILRTGSGTDNIPIDDATRRQIVVA